MVKAEIPSIAISEIKVANPRPRSKKMFDQIVASISTIGLKTPITVSQRDMSLDGTRYDLVCGQGRIEAFMALGQKTIPAIIISASKEDQFLMSLVENIARRPPSAIALLEEVKSLRARSYSSSDIAGKLGLTKPYITGIVRLLDDKENDLLRRVESGTMPLTVAIEIAHGSSADIQRALTEAYDSGDLRGPRLKTARALIRKRQLHKRVHGDEPPPRRESLTGKSLAQVYAHHTRDQRALIKRSQVIRERLALAAAACRDIFQDENFNTLLRAEGLESITHKLLEQSRAY